jgi:hypothetical protein
MPSGELIAPAGPESSLGASGIDVAGQREFSFGASLRQK